MAVYVYTPKHNMALGTAAKGRKFRLKCELAKVSEGFLNIQPIATLLFWEDSCQEIMLKLKTILVHAMPKCCCALCSTLHTQTMLM